MARQDPVSHLRRFPNGAPEALQREILALGEAAIPGLEALVDGAVSGSAEAIAAASSAAPLYARLAQLRAVPRLVDLVISAPLDGPVHAAAQLALRRVDDRKAVVEVLLATTVPEEREPYVMELVVRAGAAPAAIRERLARLIGEQPFLGARLAHYHADRELLPALCSTFDALPLSGRLEDELVQTAIALIEAILSFGSDPGRTAKLQRALDVSISLHQQDVDQLAGQIEAIESGIRRR